MSESDYHDKTGRNHGRRKESDVRSRPSEREAREDDPPRRAVVLSDNRRENDGRNRRNSTHASTSRPTTASSRSQPRRDSTSTRNGPRDIHENDKRYPAGDSRSYDISSRYHDRGSYGAAPQIASKLWESRDGYAGQENYGSSGQHSVAHSGYGTSPQETHRSAERRDSYAEQAGHGSSGQHSTGYSEYDTLERRMGSMGISEASEYGPGSGPPQLAPSTTYPTTYTGENVFNEEGDEVATPSNTNRKGSAKKSRSTALSRGRSQKLDEDYKERRNDYKQFFQRGRVFQTLWTEPCSETTNEKATRGNKAEEGHNDRTDGKWDKTKNSKNRSVSATSYGSFVYSKPRRFVVVKYKGLNCTCLAITSYDKRGHTKPGINLSEHGFIYSDKPPRNPSGIIKEPLKAKLKPGEKLSEQSLINYGESHTIQCNWKVKNIGELDEPSKKHLRNYYNLEMAADTDTEAPNSVTDRTRPLTQTSGLEGVGASLGNNRTQGSYYDHHSAQQIPNYGYDAHQHSSYNDPSSNSADQLSTAPYDSGYPQSSIYHPPTILAPAYTTYTPAFTSSYGGSDMPRSAVNTSSEHSYRSGQTYSGNHRNSVSTYPQYESGGGYNPQPSNLIPRTYTSDSTPQSYYPQQPPQTPYHSQAEDTQTSRGSWTGHGDRWKTRR